MGSTVIAWHGQVGGFSPGVADRLQFADGQRIFCKAVGEVQNLGSVALARRELAVNQVLPAGLPIPVMRHGVELADGWVLLLFDDLDGRHPRLPWRRDEFRAALASIAQVAQQVPIADPSLPSAMDLLGPDLDQFALVAADPPGDLDPWVRAHLPELVQRSAQARSALVGEALCQLDARADNMVLDAQGAVWLVDWPWACRGPAWLDLALLAMTALSRGGELASSSSGPAGDQEAEAFDVAAEVEQVAARLGADAELLTNLWVGELGYFIQMADQPPPPNLPTIRAYQAACRDGLIAVVRGRLGQ